MKRLLFVGVTAGLAQLATAPVRATNIFVSDFGAHVVHEYNDTGAFVRNLTISPGNSWNPYDVTFGPDGMLYAVDFHGNSLERFDPNTGAYLGAVGNIAAAAPFPGATSSLGVTVGPDGNFYVVTNQDDVYKINPALGTQAAGTTLVYSHALGANGNWDLAFIPNTTTLLAMFGSGNKVIYEATGNLFASGPVNARGITFGPDGRLYIADRSDFTTGAGKIRVVSAAGGAATVFASSPVPPSGEINFEYLDFDSAGNLWASTASKIYEFDGNGAFIEAIGQTGIPSQNLVGGLGIAVQPNKISAVPESGSMITLLCGLGLIGTLIRRGWAIEPRGGS